MLAVLTVPISEPMGVVEAAPGIASCPSARTASDTADPDMSMHGCCTDPGGVAELAAWLAACAALAATANAAAADIGLIIRRTN